MARQVGPLFFTGTVDGLIFYKLGDNYYMRSKGDYKWGKQMRKDPTYKRTLQQDDRFGGASNMLKSVYYRYLPKAVRKHGLYGRLTGLVNTWLYQGKSKEEVRELLIAHCRELAATVTTAAPKTALKAQPAGMKTTVNTLQPTCPKNRTTINCQRTTINTQPSTNVEHRTTINARQSPNTGQRPSKPLRYRSCWKVKRNGRLQAPQKKPQNLSAEVHVLHTVSVSGGRGTSTLTNAVELNQLE